MFAQDCDAERLFKSDCLGWSAMGASPYYAQVC